MSSRLSVNPSNNASAGLGDVFDESCGGDAEEKMPPELDENPGTTRGTKWSVLHVVVFPSLGQPWFLTADPLLGISVFFAEFFFQAIRLRVHPQGLEPSRRASSRERITVASSFVCTDPLAVKTFVGFPDTRTVLEFRRVQIFPAQHVQLFSGVYHKLSFLKFLRRWCW